MNWSLSALRQRRVNDANTERMSDTEGNHVRTVLASGETVEVHAGTDLNPHVHRGQILTLAPVDPALVEFGDIVFAVAVDSPWIGLVLEIESSNRRVLLDSGGHRFWTNLVQIYGLCTAVAGLPRPRVDGKIRVSAT